jgi:hypothetical protein
MWTGNKAFFVVIALLLGALGVESARSMSELAGTAPPPVLEHRIQAWDAPAPAAADGGAGETVQHAQHAQAR